MELIIGASRWGFGGKQIKNTLYLPPIRVCIDDMTTLRTRKACARRLLGKIQENIGWAQIWKLTMYEVIFSHGKWSERLVSTQLKQWLRIPRCLSQVLGWWAWKDTPSKRSSNKATTAERSTHWLWLKWKDAVWAATWTVLTMSYTHLITQWQVPLNIQGWSFLIRIANNRLAVTTHRHHRRLPLILDLIYLSTNDSSELVPFLQAWLLLCWYHFHWLICKLPFNASHPSFLCLCTTTSEISATVINSWNTWWCVVWVKNMSQLNSATTNSKQVLD